MKNECRHNQFLKRHLLIAGVFFLFGSLLKAQLLFKLDDDSVHVFAYKGGDEFNGSQLNTDDWKDCQWPSFNMSQEFVYARKNVRIGDGMATFAMTKKDSVYRIPAMEIDSNFLREKKMTLDDQRYLFHYAAGSIVSKQKWHYGFYELRFKVEEGKGVWPAFWFFGGNKNEEIDVFEMKGERNDEIHVDMHCPYGCDRGYKNKLGFNANWGGWLPVSDYLHNGFNLMQLEWNPEGLTWYVNGYPLAWFRGNLANPMNIYINTQVAKDGRAFKPGPDKTTPFPNNFYVDYLRVWEPVSGTVPVLSKKELAESDKFSSRYDTKPTRKRGLMYSKKDLDTKGMVHLSYGTDKKVHVTVLGLKDPSKLKLAICKTSGEKMADNLKTGDGLDLPASDYELRISNGKKEYRQAFRISN